MADETTDAQQGGSDEAPGWNAIDAACELIYGHKAPKHYGTVIPSFLGGNDPLQGISVYQNDAETPHWHYVTYGFSELYAKETEDPEVSGYGFELTFRLPRHPNSAGDPPTWPLNFLQNIARYVFKTGNCFAAHHHVDLNGPIALDDPTEITAICFEKDPQLGSISTPNGAVDFLQIVGLTGDEYQLAKRSSSEVLLRHLARESPLLITELWRDSLLADSTRKQAIETDAIACGSKQGEFYAMLAESQFDGDKFQFRLTANAVGDFLSMLELRTAAGKPFTIFGKGNATIFVPDDDDSWTISEGNTVEVFVSPELTNELLGKVEVRRGIYQFESCPNFTLEVVPTEIKDGDGKKVIRVVG